MEIVTPISLIFIERLMFEEAMLYTRQNLDDSYTMFKIRLHMRTYIRHQLLDFGVVHASARRIVHEAISFEE